ncbi:UNVERIFIED_CONTAM: hypothetical protein HDU68_007070 [Siphonaria sp. JEL0065]|nr:hypothetical protein HDU68_007070 [Siphonaria sp. JEL0065]
MTDYQKEDFVQPPTFFETESESTTLLINDYNGPIIIKKGFKFLHRIEFEYSNAPVYFDARMPGVLEKKISQLTYANRIAALNQELHDNKAMIEAFLTSCWAYYVAAAVSMVFVLVIGTFVDSLWFSAMFLPFIVLGCLPYDSEYVTMIKKHVDVWNAENESLGVNVVFKVDPRRPRNGSPLIVVPIMVMEKESSDENREKGVGLP